MAKYFFCSFQFQFYIFYNNYFKFLIFHTILSMYI